MKKTLLLVYLFLTTIFLQCQNDKSDTTKPVKSVKTHKLLIDLKIKDSLKEIDITKLTQFPVKNGLGKGENFTTHESRYKYLKNNPHVYWAVSNCLTKEIISESKNSKSSVFGASVPKIIIASAAIEHNGGRFKNINDWRQALNLLVISQNDPYWTNMQNLSGGAAGVRNFCNKMNYKMNPEKVPGGTTITAHEMAKFYIDLTNLEFNGSDAILAISSTCATSSGRSKVFIPDSIYMGGKTGTWSQYIHDTGWLFYRGQYWSIVVLSDGWFPSSDIAIMWGGLFREYIEKSLDIDKVTSSSSTNTISKKSKLKKIKSKYSKKKSVKRKSTKKKKYKNKLPHS